LASRRHIFSRFWRDTEGAALTEALIVMLVLVMMVAAFIELTVAVNQWNMAVKAMQVGARVASVSHPVDTGLGGFSGLAGGASPGDPSPAYSSTCSTGGSCSGSGNITHGYDANAMERILDRMERAFPSVRDGTLTISYNFGGLGYAGRPDGPVPVISLTLSNVPFNFLLLGAFTGTDTVTMPAFTVTAIGEDLRTTYP
jgi:Flp pilus assembly pilin Flp